MKQSWKRMLAVALLLCMTVALLPVQALATDVSMEAEDQPLGQVQLPEEAVSEPLDKGGILKLVDEASFEAQNFVYRATAEESLNSYVFQKESGEKTLYLFPENVKFVKDGQVLEKDTTLVKEEQGYHMAQNDVQLLLPEDPAMGIFVGYGTGAIRLRAHGLADDVQGTVVDNAMIYADAFGDGVDLKYTPLLSGVKEDIVLDHYIANAAYTFTLETMGLSLYQDSEGWYLAAGEEAKATFRLGQVLVYDAMGRPSYGTMEVETVRAGTRYNLSIRPDESYMADPNTVYPVTIDPTIELGYETLSGMAIEDSILFSAYPNYNYGTFLYDSIGTTQASYGTARTVIKLTGLINSTIYQGLNADQILSAEFHVWEASGRPSQLIHLYPLTQNTTWTESTVTWNNAGAFDTSWQCAENVTDSQRTIFYITDLVKAWKAGTYPANAGFILINDDETAYKQIFACDHSRADLRPYVQLNYYEKGTGGGDTLEDATLLSEGQLAEVSFGMYSEKRYFKFVPSATGIYRFTNSDTSSAPAAYLYNPLGEELVTSPASSSTMRFTIDYHLIANKTYYLAVGPRKVDLGAFRVMISRMTSTQNLSFEPRQGKIDSHVSTACAYASTSILFIPNETKEYVFYTTTSGTSDPYLWIYGSNGQLMAYDDDTAGNRNARITINLDAGVKYCMVIGQSDVQTGACNVATLDKMILPTGTYALVNTNGSKYLDIEDGSSQLIPILNAEFCTEVVQDRYRQQIWTIRQTSDGYYTIQSQASENRYLGVSPANTVMLIDSVTIETKWVAYEGNNGRYVFAPASEPYSILCPVSSLSGSRFELRELADADWNGWRLEPRTAARLQGQEMSMWCWVATAKMFAEHYYGESEKMQYDAAYLLDDGAANDGGTEKQVAQAIDYFADGRLNEDPDPVYRLTYSYKGEEPNFGILDEDSIMRLLDAGHVVCITRAKRTGSGERKTSHIMLICGYTYDNATNEWLYILYDPWPPGQGVAWMGRRENDGQIKLHSYQWICNSSNTPNEIDPDYTDPDFTDYWEGFVILSDTDVQINIIDPDWDF